MAGYIILGVSIFLFFFILYLVYDLASSNLNAFLDKWVKKTLWLWLPFYALRRLVREMFFDKK
ncbi:MAG TPA: hypothetical protein P5262_01915 [Candidatus Moranbacteria bacterium]|nr:hypothetical protein [Candidatus Moranbacteria bacterium]